MERRWLTGGAVGVIGLLLAVVQIAHSIQQTTVPIAVAVDAVPFVAMSLGVAFVGIWMARQRAFEDQATRVGLWGVGGMVAMAAIAALVLFGQRITTGTLERAAYLTIDLVTVGAVGGVLVGLYDARSRRRRLALEDERDRIEAFAGKAADVNNYGRAIYGARSVDGVAAYVVEAVESLIGLRETAVARVGEDDVELIADTTRSIDPATIAALAREAARGEPRDVVVHEVDDGIALPPAVTTVVSALLYDEREGAIAVVALGSDGATVAEKDRQLLELVVGHAAATIRRVTPAPEQRP
jgi:hypothetical protein